jgi:membrane protease YdiL (CAAX protease family)
MAYLPVIFACVFVGALVAAYIYAKGYDGGSGVVEGARFGVLVGIFIAAIFAGVNYATLNIGRRHSLELAIAGFVEWMLVGIVIGLVYKPSPAGAK